eukprot:403349647
MSTVLKKGNDQLLIKELLEGLDEINQKEEDLLKFFTQGSKKVGTDVASMMSRSVSRRIVKKRERSNLNSRKNYDDNLEHGRERKRKRVLSFYETIRPYETAKKLLEDSPIKELQMIEKRIMDIQAKKSREGLGIKKSEVDISEIIYDAVNEIQVYQKHKFNLKQQLANTLQHSPQKNKGKVSQINENDKHNSSQKFQRDVNSGEIRIPDGDEIVPKEINRQLKRDLVMSKYNSVNMNGKSSSMSRSRERIELLLNNLTDKDSSQKVRRKMTVENNKHANTEKHRLREELLKLDEQDEIELKIKAKQERQKLIEEKKLDQVSYIQNVIKSSKERRALKLSKRVQSTKKSQNETKNISLKQQQEKQGNQSAINKSKQVIKQQPIISSVYEANDQKAILKDQTTDKLTLTQEILRTYNKSIKNIKITKNFSGQVSTNARTPSRQDNQLSTTTNLINSSIRSSTQEPKLKPVKQRPRSAKPNSQLMRYMKRKPYLFSRNINLYLDKILNTERQLDIDKNHQDQTYTYGQQNQQYHSNLIEDNRSDLFYDLQSNSIQIIDPYQLQLISHNNNHSLNTTTQRNNQSFEKKKHDVMKIYKPMQFRSTDHSKNSSVRVSQHANNFNNPRSRFSQNFQENESQSHNNNNQYSLLNEQNILNQQDYYSKNLVYNPDVKKQIRSQRISQVMMDNKIQQKYQQNHENSWQIQQQKNYINGSCGVISQPMKVNLLFGKK